LYQKHFDLGKTRSATTEYEKQQWMSVICIDYVAHDCHRQVVKLPIFIQRCCAFFCSEKSLVFYWCKIFVAGL